MDELTLDNKKYLSSKRAAQVTGYAKDYVGQLCREGRVDARLVGRNWYVLETSILEHRFGAEDAAEPMPEPKKTPLATWEQPRYSSESAESVPQLAPKPAPIAPVPPEAASTPHPESAETPNVLGDMQSAWKEWFDRQEKALPDASPMLLEDHITAPEAPEPVEEAFEAVAEDPVAIHRMEEEEECPVHIERVRPAPLRAMQKEALFDLRTERSAGMSVSSAPLMPKMTRKTTRRVKAKRGNFALQAFFVGLVLITLAVTAIGSGVLDDYIGTTHTAITDFFSGQQQVEN